MKTIELTFLIPCLNEEDTIKQCIYTCQKFLNDKNITGEILVIDNNSSDKSYSIAKKAGARVIKEKKKGYGNALKKGIQEAKGKFIIMGDADCSYDFSASMPIYELLNNNYDLVIGNRFKGGIEKKAMPFSHKYIGNPLLSFIGKKLFHIKIGDFHCGLRGFDTEKIKELDLQCEGMDFASEMIIRAQKNNLSITEIPVKLYKDGRINCTSHLNTLKDGMLHLNTMFKIYRKYKKNEKNL